MRFCLNHKPGVPKLSLAMYPFSIWIDEHVPLNMGAGSFFFQGGTNNGFSRVGPKIFCRGEQKWQNYILTTRNLGNNFFAKKVDGKMSNFKILEGPCPILQTPMLLKLILTKKLRKISKLYLSISTWWRLRNGVPQGSVLAYFLFNTYISDLSITVSGKYAYADDLAIMHVDWDWQAVEGMLTKAMATVGEYLKTWKLKLTTKTVSATFHLNNKEAKRELKSNTTTKPCPSVLSPNTSE